jgi:formate hydrogenlyase subunit 4
MKFLLFLALLSNLVFPWGVALDMTPGAILAGVAALVLKLVVLASALAVLETRLAKLRLFRVPELLSVSFLLALLAITSSFLVR